tara:strand:+ start:557 stop:1045 length:489 start_codon:yes stop_codon:yes gene_type:complete
MKPIIESWRLFLVVLALTVIVCSSFILMRESANTPPEKVVGEIEVTTEPHSFEKPIMIMPTKEAEQVIMYSAPWCKWCKVAKEFFKEKKISYIEKSIQNKEEYEALVAFAKRIKYTGPLNAVPIFIIKDNIILGFNKREIMCILELTKCDAIEFIRSKTELD